MEIPAELGSHLCGILSACWSRSYPNLIKFAEALERLAANARVHHARLQASEGGDRLIG